MMWVYILILLLQQPKLQGVVQPQRIAAFRQEPHRLCYHFQL